MAKKISAAIFSGALLILSFPPFGIWPLAWVGFVPLLISLEGTSPARGALLGYITGFTFFLGTVYWVVNSMHFYGGLGIMTSVPVMLLLVAFLSLYPGLFGLFSRPGGRRRALTLLFLPALWVALEYLRGWLFSGFPWVLLGYSQAPLLTVIQIADITGVWGISFLVILVNSFLYLCLSAWLGRERRQVWPVKEGLITVLVILAVIVYGSFRIKGVDRITSTWRGLKVALAQGNIDQSVKWDEAYQGKTLRIYRGLTERAKAMGAELVVWPETAVPFYLERDPAKKNSITGIPREHGLWLLTGSPAFDYNVRGRSVSLYNSAYLISPSGEIHGRYDKVHLVPYGEYVPLKRFFPFIKKLTAGVGDFSSGPGPLPLSFRAAPIGTVICYEAIFPDLTRRFVKNGARLLVNITNDAWFGRSSAPYQHFEMSVLRAVENRVFMLRAANTGISAVVDPVGRIGTKSALFTEALIVETIGIKEDLATFYTRYGDIFAYICVFSAGLFIIVFRPAAGRKKEYEQWRR